MIDNVNPSSQFHPYQPPDVTPQSGSTGRLSRLLRRAGIDESKIDALGSRMSGMDLSSLRNRIGSTDVRGQVDRVRNMARAHPGAVLGGIAALAIGAGLMRRRSLAAGRV